MSDKARMKVLAQAAVEALEDGRDPLEISFLTEHGVTLDEAYSLAETMALALRLLMKLPLIPDEGA